MSRYSILLSKIIAESNLTAKEVVEKCNALGNKIDTTRLSKLQSGTLSAPSDKVSKVIAKVCNVDYRPLVLEGYLEKAPKEIIDALTSIRNLTYMSAMKTFENISDKATLKELEKQLEKQPLSDFIIALSDYKPTDISVLDKEINYNFQNNNLEMIFQNPVSLKVTDNSMYPIIPNNSEITLKLQEKYSDGDILAIKLKKEDNFIVRYTMFKDKSIVLTSLNARDYQILEYKSKDVVILGKVITVKTTIQN